ncbi:patatin-like phospholipase family protein [Pararhizobium sp. LjRoot235]|uniref:patatin-like phospholipase family protein n=1 Tax=Pararhizobium sp. LjRoot235 TaxID=3342291 RepID=UPI003ECDECB5
MTSTSGRSSRIGLALSGGGIRAAVFHLGVLRRLAEAEMLEQVVQISTVSGGSLVTGAIFSEADGQWPSSERFLAEIYPRLRTRLTETDLFSLKALGIAGLLKKNVRILNRRAHILSELLQTKWGIGLKLCDLPSTPVWHINTTCYETGKNWRFTHDSMGDWQFGRHYSPDVPVSDAIAASAAVPYAIGALRLKLPIEGWWETDPATKKPLRTKVPPTSMVRLWDGGAYENMALEQLYKPMKGLDGCDVLVCSDASGPLGKPKSLFRALREGSLAAPRLFDITSDQIRSLRSRMLIKSIRDKDIDGFLFRLGTSARKFTPAAGKLPGLSDEQCGFCLNYPTDLLKIEAENFDLLASHGAEVAHLTLAKFAGGRFVSRTKNDDSL